jgi:hypothetical protein
MYNEIQNDTDESLLAEPDSIDSERAERSSSTAAQRKQRAAYMKSWRRKTNDPRVKQETAWAANWQALADAEREALTAKQEDRDLFVWMLGKIARATIQKDFQAVEHYQPDTLNEIIQDWIADGNFLVGPPIPREMAHLPEVQEMFADDPQFQQFGIHTHLSDMSYEYFQENLRKYRRHKSGESPMPTNISFVQKTGLSMTEKQEAALVESEIRKSVLGR